MADLELFGTASCPYTGEMREQLEWDRRSFVEHDVESDPDARARLRALTGAVTQMVPVLVEHGHVVQVGWQGRGCFASLEPTG